jgi:hypothetical protein
MLLTGHLTDRAEFVTIFWDFLRQFNYSMLITNTTKLRMTSEGMKPTYIIRDEVMDRLEMNEELHTFLSHWRNSPLLFFTMNKDDLT